MGGDKANWTLSATAEEMRRSDFYTADWLPDALAISGSRQFAAKVAAQTGR